MSNWYVMRTVPDMEENAAALMQRSLPGRLWSQCRCLSKQKLFRSKGQYLLCTEKMFPGYIFIQTDTPAKLQEELKKVRKFPMLIGNQNIDITPVEEKELLFLQSICGENLQNDMGLSKVQLDEEGNMIKIEGVLKPYIRQVTRKRLRKRYVLASVELFNRKEDILFGIMLPKDKVVHSLDTNQLHEAKWQENQ